MHENGNGSHFSVRGIAGLAQGRELPVGAPVGSDDSTFILGQDLARNLFSSFFFKEYIHIIHYN